jgi:hypothetical protein
MTAGQAGRLVEVEANRAEAIFVYGPQQEV